MTVGCNVITYPSLSQLDSTRFAALKQLLQAVIQAYNPNVDLATGTLNTLVLHARTLLAQTSEVAITNALNSGSLSFITANPTLADDDAVNRVLGNYRITRQTGTKASGSLTIVLSAQTPIVIAQGAVFTLNGQTFAADQVYAARTSQLAVVGPGDRLLVPAGGNNWSITINVVATAVGSAGNVSRGTAATPAANPINFVQAFATSDFAGGTDPQTNQQLLARLASGLACQTWSNRTTILSFLQNLASVAPPALDYPTLQGISVIGFMDPEMIRDRHSLWPVSGGGRADLYARTALTYQTVTVSKVATLVGINGSQGTWQFGLTKDDAPGYYEVAGVQLPTNSATTFPITTDNRSLDLTATGWKPDLVNLVEGIYSRYQAGVYQFVDTITNAQGMVVGTTQQTYNVLVRAMPQIGQMQDMWNRSANRPTMGDVLVKAPIPAFTTVTCTLNVPATLAVSTAAVQQAIATAINQLPFGTSLASSYLNQVIHNAVPGLLSVTSLGMSCRIRKPDGSQVFQNTTTILTIPEDDANMTSPRTVAFLTDPTQIGVTVVSS